MSGERGQAALIVVAGLAIVLVAAVALGATAAGVTAHGDRQRAADLGALSGARAMREAFAGRFAPARIGGRANPVHVERAAYLARGRAAAVETARRNGAGAVAVAFPDGAAFAPVRLRVTVGDAHAEAQLVPPDGDGSGWPSGVAGEYAGPFAYRQWRPMRPDAALAFDRLEAAAGRDGIVLVIASAFRSDAEQAQLYAAHPDPHWVAPPGRSLHRLGTELDLGPPSAYAWLAANAGAFHFVRRYAWEPWHFGLALNAASAGSRAAGDGTAGAAPAAFIGAVHAAAFAGAAQRWSVSAALLAAQSRHEPRLLAAPGIGVHAHRMRDLLRRFGSVALALAAYKAGPRAVAACGCVPADPGTARYVAEILGLLNGAGDPAGAGAARLTVRLVG